ncbi:vanillate O-demethylase oxygenase, partial [Alcaligenes faecalis subsp. faecalis NCIB 8687]
ATGIPVSKMMQGEREKLFYHGLTFDCSGSCTKAPGVAQIPKSAVVRSYPCAERYGLVWVWMGDKGMVPSLGTRSAVGLKPVRPLKAEGIRIEPPEDEPPGIRALSRSQTERRVAITESRCFVP